MSKDLFPRIDISSQKIIDEITRLRSEKNNFQTIKKQIGESKLIELIKNFYPKYDITLLEKIMKVPDSTLLRWFDKLRIKANRNHIFNESIVANFNKETILYSNNTVKKVSAIKMTPGLAYLVGFTLGDGATQKYMVEVFNKDRGMYNYLLKTMKNFGAVTLDQRANGLWRIRLSSKLISDLIKRNKKMRKETVDFILNNDRFAPYFIAGLWDAEGSVLKQAKYYHVYFYNSNKKLIDLVGNYLSKSRIDFSIIKIKERRKSFTSMGRTIIPRKQMYRLGVPKKSVDKWAELIGLYLLHSKKSKIVKEIIKRS